METSVKQAENTNNEENNQQTNQAESSSIFQENVTFRDLGVSPITLFPKS